MPCRFHSVSSGLDPSRLEPGLALGAGGYVSDHPPVNLRKDTDMSGTSDKITGRLKQAAGDLTDDESLEREGERDETAGKAKDAVDDAKDRVNDAIDSVKDKFNS